MSDVVAPIEVFYSYGREDEALQNALEKHLSLLHRQGQISSWHNRRISPGTNSVKEISTHLETASLVLLLISSDFLNSDYCYEIEMQRVMERHEAGLAQVIPIIVRPCDWSHAPFAHLQALPSNGVPVTLWRDQDEAFANIVAGIRRVIDEQSAVLVTPSTRSFPKLWNVPFAQNFFFTGHNDLLVKLEQAFHTGQSSVLSQPQAISGLGGVGKTQLAVEYAYRYAQNYEAVFWVRADTHEAIVSGYVILAQNLNLPEKEEKDQNVIVQAVLRWLSTHTRWLLILDNADDLAVLEGLLPSKHCGHLLLTTRAQALGILAHPLEVAIMPQDIGATLLLRRVRLIATDADLHAALPADVAVARAIYEHWLGETSPETARILNDLATFYRVQGKYGEAEPLCLRALAINEQQLGANHPDTASSLNNLARLYQAQGKYGEAEPLCLRALAINEQQLGTNHSRTAQSLNNLARLYQAQGKYGEAEPLCLRALAINEQQLGADHPDTASSLHGLADLYLLQGKYEQVEVLYQRTLVIREQRLGSNHPDTQSTRKAYATFLHLVGRDTEATMLDISHRPSAEGSH